jgi:hypothetical protein
MKRVAALLIAVFGVVLLEAGAFALGAAALDPDNPFNGFNLAYCVPAVVIGALALAGAARAWRSGRAAAPRA